MIYRGISISPMHGSFVPGYDPPPSDLENLVAGRERELGNLVNQAVVQGILGGQINVPVAPRTKDIFGNVSSLSQNILSSFLVSQGRI